MYIIIAGAGEVGSHIASLLIEAKHEVTIIEQSGEIVDNVRRQLEVNTIIGNAATPRILRETEVHRADLIIAATNNDETNMLTCFLAKELGAAMTVARVRNPEYSGYFITAAKSPPTIRKVIRPRTLGIDLFISPESEVAREITNLFSSFYPYPVENFADGRIQIKEFKVGEKRSLKKALDKIRFTKPCVVAAITRAGEVIMPTADEVLQPDDHVYLVAARECMDGLGEMFAQPQRPVKNVVILGGGRVGFLIAEGLHKYGISVKVIEKDISRGEEIAAKLEGAIVLQGDGTDRDFLIEQEVPSADAFVATTESDELNILCGLLAKNLGVPRSVIMANRPGYIPLAEAIGIDVVSSPSLITAGKIAHFVLHGGAISAAYIGGKEVQAIEFVTSARAHAARRKVSKAGLPKEAIVGGIVRNGRVIIPPDDSTIQPGDHIIIISPLSVVPEVEKLFK
ncbi:Trk system potassium transporter TrkA [Chloroflexota bacterium]